MPYFLSNSTICADFLDLNDSFGEREINSPFLYEFLLSCNSFNCFSLSFLDNP